ncbi:galactose mutarotase-like domain-containing protein [Cyathus striatus]|nr:galactose mutarotase-like domain-containing protein [Cyathus striatus]
MAPPMFYIFLCTLLVLAAGNKPGAGSPFLPIHLYAPDGSAKADFIALGATTTNFWVKDKNGNFRDIILGFDNLTMYQTDELGHPYFGPVVGRYANRIRRGTFTIPISKDATGPNKFHVPLNEGNNTLHGGQDGYDRRAWNVIKQSSNSVAFSLIDPNGEQGFPGTVFTQVTYTLEEKATWDIKMHSKSTEETPIMLSAHHYWNLEGYQETQDLNGHITQFPSSRYVETDGQLIPTGKLVNVAGTPMDFRHAKSIGHSIPATTKAQFCGTNCTGFDNCWVFDKVEQNKPDLSIWSVNSGIKLDIFTNQIALQIYTCNGIFNATLPIPRKSSQGGPTKVYENHSCVVIESESIIDAINNPELGVNQIFGPQTPYIWKSSYKFSII